MDFLQIGLVFLIALLSVFLSITGFQVFLILKDLKKALNKLNQVLFAEEEQITEKLKAQAKKAAVILPKTTTPKRFFKK